MRAYVRVTPAIQILARHIIRGFVVAVVALYLSALINVQASAQERMVPFLRARASE